jgi:hypothetical protein
MNVRAAILLALGLAQMTFDVLGLRAPKAVAAASGASPAPKVFSAVAGFETYSTRFAVEWRDAAGAHRREIDADLYARLRGPYNRRNVYGAALAYGPVLAENEATKPMLDAVLAHALCGEAPLLLELELASGEVTGARVVFEPVAGTEMGRLPRMLVPECGARR